MRRVVALFAVMGVFAACSDLKRADDAPADGDPDGGNASDGTTNGGDDVQTPPADAGIDVGQPPSDFECSETWIKTTKSKPECAPRVVKEIDDGVPEVRDISIARTPAGRVAIALHAPSFIDEGELRFYHFVPKTPTYAVEEIFEPPVGIGAQPGYHVKLGASAPDTIHVLAHDVDQNVSGDLVHYRLVDGKKPFTTPRDLVIPALQQRSEIALAVEPSTGNVLATARVTSGTKDGGLEVAKLAARRKQPGGAFTAMPDLVTDLSPDEAPGTGAASLLFDGTGVPNVLYHHCDSNRGSQPRHHVFDGALWSIRKTVANGDYDGFAGFSPRLAVSGNLKIAAFFFRKGLQGGAYTADLRIATWSLSGDTPKMEVVEQGFPSPDPSSPRYRVAMAVDVYGLIHLAVVAPSPNAGAPSGTLDYVRQTRVDGGGTKWLTDVVDDDVIVDDQDAFVDLVVDEKGRPHIAYRSGADYKIRYATRYDR